MTGIELSDEDLLESERIVLAVLDGQALKGLDIVKNSGGLLRRVAIYVLLNSMEERRLVFSWEDKDQAVFERLGIRRRYYQGSHFGFHLWSQYLARRRS
jgi:DNA-binding PadR family transcriptional regulator